PVSDRYTAVRHGDEAGQARFRCEQVVRMPVEPSVVDVEPDAEDVAAAVVEELEVRLLQVPVDCVGDGVHLDQDRSGEGSGVGDVIEQRGDAVKRSAAAVTRSADAVKRSADAVKCSAAAGGPVVNAGAVRPTEALGDHVVDAC